MTKLFLLKPNFSDIKLNESEVYYCPHCAMIEGILKYYPFLEEMIEINYLDFQRPRQKIINIIGKENQGCPVLIIHRKDVEKGETEMSDFRMYGEFYFSNSTKIIANYLANKYKTGIPHP